MFAIAYHAVSHNVTVEFVREIFNVCETTPLLRISSEEEWMGLEQET